jgi:hypothetical protein
VALTTIILIDSYMGTTEHFEMKFILELPRHLLILFALSKFLLPFPLFFFKLLLTNLRARDWSRKQQGNNAKPSSLAQFDVLAAAAGGWKCVESH